jgi:hypothetical protein
MMREHPASRWLNTKVILITGLLILWALVSCGIQAPGSPTAIATLPVTSRPNGAYAFAIYLLANDVSPDKLTMQCHLELASEPVLTIDDIVSYTQTTHMLELTSATYERLHAFQVPTSGKPFAVSVNGEVVYSGAFWTMISSQSYDGVVIILDPIALAPQPIIQVQLGYPGPDFFKGEDPRSDPRIIKALKDAGKLR